MCPPFAKQAIVSSDCVVVFEPVSIVEKVKFEVVGSSGMKSLQTNIGEDSVVETVSACAK